MSKKKLEESIEETKSDFIKNLSSKGYSVRLANHIETAPKLRTGLFALDYVLDGGIRQAEGGCKIEFFGKESSAKTSYALKVIAQFQKLGKSCLFIDAEESFSEDWATKLGVDVSKLAVGQPKFLEDGADMMIDAVKNDVDLIVLDSIPALVPKRELEGSVEDMTIGLQARLLAHMCRILNTELAHKFTTMIFINQIREKIGVMYGSPETTAGGRALRHFYNARIKFKCGQPHEVGTNDNKEKIGFVSQLVAEKNKTGKPWRVAAVDFFYEGIIDNKKSLLHSAIKYGIITRSGAWFDYKGTQKQGAVAMMEAISDDEWAIIEEKVWEHINGKVDSK